MKRTEIAKLYASPESYTASPVTVCGWIRTNRDSKTLGFMDVNDGSCFKGVQVVFEANKVADFQAVAKLNVGTAVIVTGDLILTPEAKQPFEINANTVEVEGASTPDYPLQKKRHSVEYLRTIAHLRPRTNLYSAAFRVRSAAAFALHRFFNENGFIYAHTPLISCSDAEGAGEMFRVTTLDMENPPRNEDGTVDFSQDFFGKSAFLTVSGQLQGEIMAQAFGKIYTFGPTFRAEKSYTQRHAAEFWMIEPEIAFADLNDDMALAEAMIKYVIRYVSDDQIRHPLCARYLSAGYGVSQPVCGQGPDRTAGSGRFVRVRPRDLHRRGGDYPKEIKAFYMRLNDDGKTVAACDCLVMGIGEIIGGSQREERYDVLLNRIRELGLKEEDYWWYLDLRKYGGTKHAGFGLGFERLVMYLTGISNIRDVLPFPRTTGSADF